MTIYTKYDRISQMKSFSTVALPIVNIPVETNKSSVVDILTAVLTYFSLATDIKQISDDMRHASGTKPHILAFRNFIQLTMRDSKIAFKEFPEGAFDAAKIYFSIYPHKIIEKKINRYFNALNRCKPNARFSPKSKLLRLRKIKRMRFLG